MLGLEDSARKLNNSLLQALLASEYVLAIKARNFHWNVKSDKFQMYHSLFGTIYEDLDNQADEIAERMRQLDGVPDGSLQGFLDHSFLKEGPKPASAEGMLKCLIEDTDKIVSEMRLAVPKAEENKDFGTMDLITKWMETHEKHLYFLRSHVV